MFVLRAYQLEDNQPIPCEKCEFPRLPIRIGRHPLNDFSPQNGMVSSFHARIEDNDGKICIRDLGSTNGVFVAQASGGIPARVDANTSVDLALGGYCFYLGPRIAVRLEVVQEEAKVRGSAMSRSVLGNLAMIAQPGSNLQPEGVQPVAREAAGAGHSPAPAEPSGYPLGRSNPPPGAPSPSGGAPHYGASPDPARPPELVRPPPDPQAVQPAPPWPPASPNAPSHGAGSLPAGFAPIAPSQSPGPDGPPESRRFDMELDTLALQGLRELSESLVPGRPLATTGDIVRLITKLHDAVDVFCRCFIPMRDGHAQFVSSLDLQRTAAQRTMNRSRSAIALETATTAEAVAMALLDPRDHTFDAPEAVEGIFADLMLHQLALLDGVMQGVRALLGELSPQSIDAAVAHGTAGLFTAKHQARWSELCQRFARLSDERQAFSVIFGKDFVEVYRQYRRRKDGGG